MVIADPPSLILATVITILPPAILSKLNAQIASLVSQASREYRPSAHRILMPLEQPRGRPTT